MKKRRIDDLRPEYDLTQLKGRVDGLARHRSPRHSLDNGADEEGDAMITLTVDDVRTLARAVGLTIKDDEIGPLTERFNATRAHLASVPDALLADCEPAFVVPMPDGQS